MSDLRLDITDGIAVVTLDKPPVNATSRETFVEFAEVFDSLHESDARVAVLTGAGERIFCGGADLKRLGSPGAERPRDDHGRAAREAFNAIYECPIPVIGAINGMALGAGVALAASCDYLIASEAAAFALPEIDVGALGGARHLGRLFPQGFTRMMHYTAKRVSAEEAYRLGVVVRVVPPGELMAAALEEAATISAKMPVGIRLAKEGLDMIEWMDLKNGYRFEQTRTTVLRKTEDAQEARQAFLEKRPPVFTGR